MIVYAIAATENDAVIALHAALVDGDRSKLAATVVEAHAKCPSGEHVFELRIPHVEAVLIP